MHLSLPLFIFTQLKDKCRLYSFTTKKLTHSLCQVSLVVKYILTLGVFTGVDLGFLERGFICLKVLGSLF